MRYERNLQAQLRERYRQLFKAGYTIYKREMDYFRKYILSIPALSTIIDAIQRAEPDFEPDKWYTEKSVQPLLVVDNSDLSPTRLTVQ
jgi:hypothetical protein